MKTVTEGVYRVELANFDGKFDLAGIRFSLEGARELADINDDYFVKILDCKNNRKCVYRNYHWRELLGIFSIDT